MTFLDRVTRIAKPSSRKSKKHMPEPTQTTAIAYRVSDFQYWNGSSWVNTVNSTQVLSQDYIRMKPGAEALTAIITDDDPYLNDRSFDSSAPAAHREDTTYIQHIEIKNSSGTTLLSNRMFSADQASINATISQADATLTPLDDTFDQGQIDIYSLITFSGSWFSNLGNTIQPYLLFGEHAPVPGEIYHNGPFNFDASDNDVQGHDQTVASQPLTNLACFVKGTLIETDTGPRRIETIRPGDLVRTKDNGFKPVSWVGGQTKRIARGTDDDRFYPVRIRAGALGGGLPERDLHVSQQHRILLRSPIVQRMFGTDEILVAAKKLTEIEGIDILRDCDEVTYAHLLFDQHEIVYSNGAETESLFTGPEALRAVGEEARREILDLFPALADLNCAASPARTVPSGKMTRKLVERHMNNSKPLYALH